MPDTPNPRDWNGHVPSDPAPDNAYLVFFNLGREVGRLEELAARGELDQSQRDRIEVALMEYETRMEALSA